MHENDTREIIRILKELLVNAQKIAERPSFSVDAEALKTLSEVAEKIFKEPKQP